VTPGISKMDTQISYNISIEQYPEKESPFSIAYQLLNLCTHGPAYNSNKTKGIIWVCPIFCASYSFGDTYPVLNQILLDRFTFKVWKIRSN